MTSGLDLVLSEAAAGEGRRKAINERVQRELGIPYAFLTESQWSEISKKTGLPHSARFELNIALRRYWQIYLDEKISDTASKRAETTVGQLKGAMQSLSEVLLDGDVFKGSVKFYSRTPLQQRAVLEKACAAMLRACQVLEEAKKRHKRRAGAPSYGPLYDLIHHLDFILFKSVGVKLTRSRNRIPSGASTDTPLEYVWTVIQRANLEVQKSTVDTILRDYLKDRDEHDRHFPDRMI